MKKSLLISVILLGSVMCYASDEKALFVGDWRIFSGDNADSLTLVLRSQENNADIDLFCHAQDYELSLYLKKKPEDGDLEKLSVELDNQKVANVKWRSNQRTRSATIITDNLSFINKLSDHKTITFSYQFATQPLKTIHFSLEKFDQVMAKAHQVCDGKTK